MTASRAIKNFYSSFGLPVYDMASVPTGDNAPDFPYITYSFGFGGMNDPVSLNMSLWYRGESWIPADTKAEEISDRIGKGGVCIAYDGGVIWLTKGSPWAQRMGDEKDDMIRRYVFNVTANFIGKE